MKIILREHVEHLGDRGDIVTVAPGYARNFLLPKGLAYKAGDGSARQIKDQKRAWAVREARNENGAQELANKLGALELEARRRAGEGGTLYGSVTKSDVAELLTEAGHKIDRRKLQMKEAIKSLGDYDLSIKLHRNVVATIKLTVLTEAGQTLEQVEADRRALDPTPEPAKKTEGADDGGEEAKAEPAEEAPAEEGQED